MTAFSKIVLPLGFRFAPTDEELVMYLQVKNCGQSGSDHHKIPEIDIYKYGPWDVPEIYEANSLIRSKDSRWYFFCPKNYTSPNSRRSKRATEDGSWKSTGQDREIISKSDRAVIAIKKILVFIDKTEKKSLSPTNAVPPRRASSLTGSSTSTASLSPRWHNDVLESFLRGIRADRSLAINTFDGGFVLCCLFKKPEQRTSSNATVQNSILPPAPPSDSDTVGASVEPVAQADQNFAVSDLQQNGQPLPQASDMQTSGEKYELLPDEASNNPSNPDVTHVTGSVLSDVPADHELNEATWVNYLKDNPPELAAPEFDGHGLNAYLLTDAELEFFKSWPCDPDECLHDASNAFSSSWKLDPEDQSRDSFSVKEMQTGVVEEKVATISNDYPRELINREYFDHGRDDCYVNSSLNIVSDTKERTLPEGTCDPNGQLHDASKNFDPEKQIFDCPDTSHTDSFSRCIYDDLSINTPTLNDMMPEIASRNSIDNFPPVFYECDSTTSHFRWCDAESIGSIWQMSYFDMG